MAHHARIEELSDSDSDPPDMDPSDFDPANSIITPADLPSASSSRTIPNMPFRSGPPPREELVPEARKSGGADIPKYAHYQCIYPVYFDITRTKAEGRRVGKKEAVENPLAREIADATGALGFRTVFEAGKTHPKDWSNPGRVRVMLKDENGNSVVGSRIKNKHHLYKLVSQYLQQHPPTEETPQKVQIRGLPPSEKFIPPAVPKGWKINHILPLHSPALSGGGISENFFKEMMQEMQREGGMPGMPGLGDGSPSGGGEQKKKKDKKKGKA